MYNVFNYLGNSPTGYTGLIIEEYKGPVTEKYFLKTWHYAIETTNDPKEFTISCGIGLNVGDTIYKPARSNYFYILN